MRVRGRARRRHPPEGRRRTLRAGSACRWRRPRRAEAGVPDPKEKARGFKPRAHCEGARPAPRRRSGALRRYFAIQVAMRAEVLSRWSAQNDSSMRK